MLIAVNQEKNSARRKQGAARNANNRLAHRLVLCETARPFVFFCFFSLRRLRSAENVPDVKGIRRLYKILERIKGVEKMFRTVYLAI